MKSSNNIKTYQRPSAPKPGKNRVLLSNNNNSNTYKSPSVTYL